MERNWLRVPLIEHQSSVRSELVASAVSLEASAVQPVMTARGKVCRSVCAISDSNPKKEASWIGTPSYFVLPVQTPLGTLTRFVEQFVAFQSQKDADASTRNDSLIDFPYLPNGLNLSDGRAIVKIVPDGVLADILKAAESLVDHYSWPSEEAVNFVLTGQVPLENCAEVRAVIDRRRPINTRLVMRVDPWLSEHTVKRIYGLAQKRLGIVRATQPRRSTVRRILREADRLSPSTRTLHMTGVASFAAVFKRIPKPNEKRSRSRVASILEPEVDDSFATPPKRKALSEVSSRLKESMIQHEGAVRASMAKRDLSLDDLTQLRPENLRPNTEWDEALGYVVQDAIDGTLDSALIDTLFEVMGTIGPEAADKLTESVAEMMNYLLIEDR
jgi:hypothetical protein